MYTAEDSQDVVDKTVREKFERVFPDDVFPGDEKRKKDNGAGAEAR
jgi:hypothetical protein